MLSELEKIILLNICEDNDEVWDVSENTPGGAYCWLLSANKNISLEFIKKYIKKIKWNKIGLALNPNINMDFVLGNYVTDWNYYTLSRSPGITWQNIIDNSHLSWNNEEISKNPNITFQIIKDNPTFPWNYNHLSSNVNITDKIVLENLDKDWNYNLLSQNPSITWNLIKATQDKPWNYYYLSFNPCVTWEIVRDNPDKPWFYQYFFMNPSLTIEILESEEFLREMRLDFDFLSNNPNITQEFIKKYVKKNWDPRVLARKNPYVTWEFIQETPELKWQFYHFGSNPNFTCKTYLLNLRKIAWDRYLIFENNFELPLKIKQEKAARLIQRNCMRWLTLDVTRDGKLGINVRLGLKELGNLKEAPLYPDT